jgi:integrase
LESVFPIQRIEIDWDRLIAKRPLILKTVEQMPVYLLKPEVLGLLATEKHPTYRLILDLMWTTGARISEVLAPTPASFIEDGYGYGVVLTTLKQRPGRPKKRALARSVKRYVPIVDRQLQIGFRAISMRENVAKGSGYFRWRARR